MLRSDVRAALERHAGRRPAVFRMPREVERRIRRRQRARLVVAALGGVVATAACLIVILTIAGRPGSMPSTADIGVPPGWPLVRETPSGLAFVPAIEGDVTDGPEVLASGTVEGTEFTVFAYTVGRDDDRAACVGFVSRPSVSSWDAVAPTLLCSIDPPPVPSARDVSLLGVAVADHPELVAHIGLTSDRVDQVMVWAGGNQGMSEIPQLDRLRRWEVRPVFFIPAEGAGPLEAFAEVGGGIMPLAHGDLCSPDGGQPCRAPVVQDLPTTSPVRVPEPLDGGGWPEVTYGGDFEPYVDHEADAEGIVDPGVVGEKTVVAYGTVQGAPWSLVAYNLRDRDAPEGVNPAADLSVAGVGGSTGGSLYETDPWRPNDLSARRMSGDGSEGFEILDGLVSMRVASVRLELDDGTVHDLTLLDGPPGVNARYFVEFIPAGVSGRLVALDPAGAEIVQMCLRDMFGLPPGGDPCA